ncbi:MAG: ribose-phosphate pyrophosphokinase [Patescibacteria group bacterium]|nr:ribose-phosphate pyrophosphokinase [Patescibacteria group bacterium]
MAQSVYLVSPNFSDLLTPNIEIGSFPDGDSHITIPQIGEVAGQSVYLFHRLYPKQNTALVVLFFMLERLKAAGAKEVAVVSPYIPYARQDKQKLPGELLAAKSLCRQLLAAGADKLVTFDCHFLNEVGEVEYEGLKIQNLSVGPLLVEHARQYFGGEDFEVIGPDDGSNYLVSRHGGKAFKKVRKEYQGKVAYRDVHEVSGDVDVVGKNVLILDDMISSGSTMIKSLEKLQAGGAKKIACAAVHGLFLFDCLDKMRQFTDAIFCSDSIPGPLAEVSIKDQLLNL